MSSKYSQELSLSEQFEVIDRNIAANWEAFKDPAFAYQKEDNYKRCDALLDARSEIQKEAELAEIREAVEEAYHE